MAARRLEALLDEFPAPPDGIYALFPQHKHLALLVRVRIALSEALHRASVSLGEGGAVESGGVDFAGFFVPVRLNALPM